MGGRGGGTIRSFADAVLRCGSAPGIGEVALDERAEAELLVQRTRPQQPGVGGDCRAPELDPKLGVERELDRVRCGVTHWVVPSASARSRREPRFLRVLRDYGLVRSAFKSKMWVKSLFATGQHLISGANYANHVILSGRVYVSCDSPVSEVTVFGVGSHAHVTDAERPGDAIAVEVTVSETLQPWGARSRPRCRL